MKTFKILVASLFFGCFLFTTNGNAQATTHWDNYYIPEGAFFCQCAGEYVFGDFWEHSTENEKFVIYNWKGELTGATSQKSYTFMGTQKVEKATGNIVMNNMRMIGEDGIVTLMHFTRRNGNFIFECK